MLHKVSSISTTIESSSLRLPPGEVTRRVVCRRGQPCQFRTRLALKTGFRTNSAEILRVNRCSAPILDNGPLWPGIFVTGPASGKSAQATSGCRQHHFCCIFAHSTSEPTSTGQAHTFFNPQNL